MLTSFLAHVKTAINSRMKRDETGATAVEYGIMVALIAVVIIGAVTLLGSSLETQFRDTACGIQGKTYSAAVADDPATTTVDESSAAGCS